MVSVSAGNQLTRLHVPWHEMPVQLFDWQSLRATRSMQDVSQHGLDLPWQHGGAGAGAGGGEEEQQPSLQSLCASLSSSASETQHPDAQLSGSAGAFCSSTSLVAAVVSLGGVASAVGAGALSGGLQQPEPHAISEGREGAEQGSGRGTGVRWTGDWMEMCSVQESRVGETRD
jgi:hypothetical protein